MPRAAARFEATEEMPLRLDTAAALAFPDGSITVSSLRREIAKGRLEAEEIAGKHFVTLAGIKRMRERCRVTPKVQGLLSNDNATEQSSGLSETVNIVKAQDAALATVKALKSSLAFTLPKSTSPNAKSATEA